MLQRQSSSLSPPPPEGSSPDTPTGKVKSLSSEDTVYPDSVGMFPPCPRSFCRSQLRGWDGAGVSGGGGGACVACVSRFPQRLFLPTLLSPSVVPAALMGCNRRPCCSLPRWSAGLSLFARLLFAQLHSSVPCQPGSRPPASLVSIEPAGTLLPESQTVDCFP